MKLSTAQQDVVNRMRDGWELGAPMTPDGGVWLQQGGLGKGGNSKQVHANTFNSLYQKGIIKQALRAWPTMHYALTPEWVNA